VSGEKDAWLDQRRAVLEPCEQHSARIDSIAAARD
jgi:hypothetical protein